MKFKNISGHTITVKTKDGMVTMEKDGVAEFENWYKSHSDLEEYQGTKQVKKSKKVNLDLNNDGKIDKKDSKIASKVMNAVKKLKKNKKNKK